jgi:hypothetical protein
VEAVMAIDYERPAFTGSFWKDETPRALDKIKADKAKLAEERKIKNAVRKRDPFCRVCLYRPSSEVHELVFKSVGGEVSLQNSLGVCAGRNSGLCHQLLQQHGIKYAFTNPEKGAAAPMRFSMNRSVADAVFGRRAVPKHVEVAE